MSNNKRKRKSMREKEFINSLIFFITVITLVFGSIIYLWVHNETKLIERNNIVLMKTKQLLIEENRKLNGDIARLMRADRITKIAEEKLGLITPSPEKFVVLIDSELYESIK
tara:strand:- start:21955 stop:22290 length:336 start_codon:yes stop_codon:yes gene_type:complete